MKHARIWAVILASVVWGVGSGSAACPSADLTGDSKVDLADFAIFAGHWLEGI